jgi:NitT/TauT family transport system substrate-binding protein
MKKSFFSALLPSIGWLLACALAGPIAGAQTLPTLRVAAPPAEDVAPIYYALKAGLFTKAGIDVQLTSMSSGAAVAAAVAGGAVDIGFSSLQGLIAGHARGLPFQLIAPGGVYDDKDPYAYLLVRADSAIRSGKDLNGKTIGAPALKDLDWVASVAWMEQHGGDPKTAKFIELPSSALGPALLEGRIDAFTVGEPWVQAYLDGGKMRILGKSFGAIAPTFLMTGWFATRDYIAKNQEAVAKFVQVIRDASIYAASHRAEIAPLLASYTKLDPDLIAKTIKGPSVVYLDPKLIQPMIDVAAKYHIIAQPFGAGDLISPAALKAGR